MPTPKAPASSLKLWEDCLEEQKLLWEAPASSFERKTKQNKTLAVMCSSLLH
jgi:hypothetical protein